MGKDLAIPESVPYLLLENLGDHDNVFTAVDKRTALPCVIKFPRPMNPFLVDGPRDHDLLEYEAIRLRRWREYPNVIQLLDQYLDCDPPFLVLEQLGRTLDQAVPENGMEFTDALLAVRPIAVALVGIHSIGDAHFDVNPNNVLQAENEGAWKLADPCPPNYYHSEVHSHRVPNNWERDILAFGRTFLYAYRGIWADEELLEEERPIEGWKSLKFEDLLQRMLWTGTSSSRHKRPSADLVLKAIDKTLQNLTC
jgi:hypothetical protein